MWRGLVWRGPTASWKLCIERGPHDAVWSGLHTFPSVVHSFDALLKVPAARPLRLLYGCAVGLRVIALDATTLLSPVAVRPSEVTM